MRRHRMTSVVACFLALVACLAMPHAASADAKADLAAGQQALAAGQADQALKLLAGAAADLPQSVEAQVALARAYLQTGDLDKALEQYRKVLALSPGHPEAKRMADALTGRRETFDRKLSVARELLGMCDYPMAMSVAAPLAAGPYEPDQQLSARLLLVEARLWSGYSAASLDDALKLAADLGVKPEADHVRVLAALARIAGGTPEQQMKAKDILAGAKALKGDDAKLAEMVTRLLTLNPKDAAEISGKLAGWLAAVPRGGYRDVLVEWLVRDMCGYAAKAAARDDLDGAIKILWPMVSGDALPADLAAQAGKPMKLATGWLVLQTDNRNNGIIQQTVNALLGVARRDLELHRDKATLVAAWVADQFLASQFSKPGDDWVVGMRLTGADRLSGMSRPSPDRVKGSPLSQADVLQRLILLDLARLATGDGQFQNVVAQAVGQIQRYEAAGDVETGLMQFMDRPVRVNDAVTVADTNLPLPSGAASRQFVTFLADAFAKIGGEDFARAALSVRPEANDALNDNDAIALLLYSRVNAEYSDAKAADGARAIIRRYAAAGKWAAAGQGLSLFADGRTTNDLRWAKVQLALQQAESAEIKQLTAHRRLSDQLNPQIDAALGMMLDALKADPDKPVVQAVAGWGRTLVDRYLTLERADLSMAVIEKLAGPGGSAKLADWALWMRTQLQRIDAARAMAVEAAQFKGDQKLTLNRFHQAELTLLGDLIEKLPDSEYAPQAFARVLAISQAYQGYQSFDVADAVLAGFLKAHPKFTKAEQVEFARVEVAMARARYAFSKRTDPLATPDKLTAEYAAAVDALAAFLKAHPTGDWSPAAEGRLIEIARTFGQEGAWSVSREVLKRFAAAAGGEAALTHPERLKLLEAATYLGELDRSHGLQLLVLPAPPNAQMGMGSQVIRSVGSVAGNRESGAGGGLFAADDDSDSARDGRTRLGASADGKPDREMDKVADELEKKLARNMPEGREYGRPADKPAEPTGPGATPGPVIHEPGGETLAMIRQSEYQQQQRLARMEQNPQGGQGRGGMSGSLPTPTTQPEGIVLPSGVVLTVEEMKRQDASADSAYAILVGLVKDPALAGRDVSRQAREQIMWMIGFFEGQLRANQAVVLVDRYLKDLPDDPARVGLGYQGLSDRLVWASQQQPTDRIDQAWIDARHKLFEEARSAVAAFAADLEKAGDLETWVDRALLLGVGSYEQEAALAATVSRPRAGGLLTRAADELIALAVKRPNHPQRGDFPSRLWTLADRLAGFGQQEQAIYVLGSITIHFPTDPRATQAVVRIAQLYAQGLSAPLRAVETYQEYLALNGDTSLVQQQIFAIAQQLAAAQRYVEALHVYGVFVDSFPADGRAPQALQAIGNIHQTNEAWADAMKAYQRLLDEYPANGLARQVKLAIAECEIQLSHWNEARRLYSEYLAQYGEASMNNNAPNQDGQQAGPQPPPGGSIASRIETLKSLARYQALLEDKQIAGKKGDAQYQIGQIVLERLGNHVKAIQEFRKVIANFPQAHEADDAQFQIGQALLELGRLDEARAELARVPTVYPNSPYADNALFLIGQSYEQQAQRLASVTLTQARQMAFESGQRGAYRKLQEQQKDISAKLEERAKELKAGGKGKQAEMEEAYNAFRYQGNNDTSVSQYSANAQWQAETESAMQVANRQDKINEAYRQAVSAYSRAATDFPLGDATDESLLRMAQIYETELKDRKAAMETYQRIVKFFPGTPVAENAAWKVARFYEAEGDYDQAVVAYRDFIRNYPASGRVADAQFALAEALEQLNRWVDAMDAYQTFREKFPTHPKAEQAKDQVQWIKAYRL
ncbi:MAG: Outer membrane protein assembly factor BamD [Phycisphaerae bacterium]|nr:Outer membrane protein assembly factor BamD [Phycisphaerae bacterium]